MTKVVEWPREHGELGETVSRQLTEQERWFGTEFKSKQRRYRAISSVQIVLGSLTPILVLADHISRWPAALCASLVAIATTYEATHHVYEDKIRLAVGIEKLSSLRSTLEIDHASGRMNTDRLIAAANTLLEIREVDLKDWQRTKTPK